MKTQISVHNLKINCIIGCLDWEREKNQLIQIDMDLSLDEEFRLVKEDINHTWDYDLLAKQCEFILKAGRFYLLEDAIRFLTRFFLLPVPGQKDKPTIESLHLVLTKFQVLPGEALAKVAVEAKANEITYDTEIKKWGWVDVIDENSRVGLYRLNLNPSCEIDNHFHNNTREAECILSKKLELTMDGKPYQETSEGQYFFWQQKQCHGYRNNSQSVQSILCLDEPPFEPSDEIIMKEVGT